MKTCAQKCHKLIKTQDDYMKEVFGNQNKTITNQLISQDFLNPEEKNIEREIQKYNSDLKNTNYQNLQADLRKNLKNSKQDDKKVFNLYKIRFFINDKSLI